MTRLQTRVVQTLIMTLGLAAAVVMVFLGLWQMQVFESQGSDAALARTRQAPVPLSDLVTPGQEVTTDAYGRAVSTSGTYREDNQVLIPVAEDPGTYRVLTALQRDDGTLVPVVRGVTDSPTAPPPPTGHLDQHGAFLASEPLVDGVFPPGQMGSVRLSLLAGMWPEPMVAGFITLTDDQARADHQLEPAPLYLPEGEGSSRNAGYALQWWVFAAAGLGFCWYIAHDLGRKQRRRELISAGLVDEKEQQ